MSVALTTALMAGALAPSVGQGIELQWSAPPQCPQHGDVRAAIDLNLAHESFDDRVHAVQVVGSVEPIAGRWILRVRTELPTGLVQREVESDTCTELAAAAGLIVAVALDPLRVLHTVEPPAAVVVGPPLGPRPPAELTPSAEPVVAPPVVEPEVAPAIESPPEVAEPPPKPARRALDLRLGVLGEFGTLAVARVGGWGSVGYVGKRFRVDLAGQYWGPRRVLPFEQEPSAGVAVQRGGVAGRACLVPTDGPWELDTCVGIEAGVDRARGVGLGRSRVTHAPWLAAAIGPQVSWLSARGVGVWVAADAMVHLVRPTWSVTDLGRVAQTGPVGFRVVLGPTVRLGR
ncbi:MAG: hypothetical protein K0V04_12280 [Deltaproteobacteria bacterium]|nr:hypothetical protein [Deltaproteobacteria bacterium]